LICIRKKLIIIIFIYTCRTVVSTSNDHRYYAIAKEDDYTIMKRTGFGRDLSPFWNSAYCNIGQYYPIKYDYCGENLPLIKTINAPYSFLFYKIPFYKDIKFSESLQRPQKKYFQLHIAFSSDGSKSRYPISLTPNKREANLYYSRYPKKEWDIFTDPMVNTVNCQMFFYGGEYKIPIPAKKGKLIIDVYPNECKDDVNRNKYTLFVNFEPDKTYELKMIQDLERSKKANEPIFDISLSEIPKEVDLHKS
jgi:hypothetical protein